MLERTHQLVNSEKSKFIFTGQSSTDKDLKLTYFGVVLFLIIMTLGLWLLVLVKFKKPVYHGYVFLENGPNPITEEVKKRIDKKYKEDFQENESIKLLIDTGSDNFLIVTDRNLHLQIDPDAKTLTGHSVINKKIPINEIESIKVKPHPLSGYLSIQLNGEIIGALRGAGFDRIEKLVQTLAEDLIQPEQ